MSLMEISSGFEGIYEIPEAARYIHLDLRLPETKFNLGSRHLIRWIRFGLAHPGLKHVPGRQLLITFQDLISMRVIAFLRSRNFSFSKIRRAEAEIRKITGRARPFATQQIWVEKEGAIDIFAQISPILFTATRGGQLAFLDMVRKDLINFANMTFDEANIAAEWQPRQGITLNPKVQFGRSCISNTRIPTSDLYGMFKAGDTIEFLARCYRIERERIQRAVDWERELATAISG